MFYHAQTYDDFVDLMNWLETKQYLWNSGSYPLDGLDYWFEKEENTLIYLNNKRIAKGVIHHIPGNLKHLPIYNAKEIKYIN